MYLLSDYHYALPEALIAQHPVANRETSRLMHIDRASDKISHHRFTALESLLQPGDLLVVNNTRVIPARLKGRKESGGKVEVLILDYAGGMRCQQEMGVFQCECMIRASKSPKPGTRLFLGINSGFTDPIEAEVVHASGGVFDVRFLVQGDMLSHLNQVGEIPLPPYIKRETPVLSREGADKNDYQTVYASQEGAVAAPTAGLHFTEGLMGRLKEKGVEFAMVTLHVGYGTFSPVRVDDIRDHQIHSEFFSISPECANAVNRAKVDGRRVIAVGTTSVRTLEFAVQRCRSDQGGGQGVNGLLSKGPSLSHSSGTTIDGRPPDPTKKDIGADCEAGERSKKWIGSGSGMCDLFIYPGYPFKVVDAMITNFHLPESTLLMLISAFYEREKILSAYREAVEKRYRFFSYGDAMFIE